MIDSCDGGLWEESGVDTGDSPITCLSHSHGQITYAKLDRRPSHAEVEMRCHTASLATTKPEAQHVYTKEKQCAVHGHPTPRPHHWIAATTVQLIHALFFVPLPHPWFFLFPTCWDQRTWISCRLTPDTTASALLHLTLPGRCGDPSRIRKAPSPWR